MSKLLIIIYLLIQYLDYTVVPYPFPSPIVSLSLSVSVSVSLSSSLSSVSLYMKNCTNNWCQSEVNEGCTNASNMRVPALPANQDKLINKYRESRLNDTILRTYVIFPKHANRKNRRLNPSVDFLRKFLTT
jgi:hypothetical protein